MGKKRNRSKARHKAKENNMAAASTFARTCYSHPITRAVRLNEKYYMWGASETQMRTHMQTTNRENHVKFILGFDLAGWGKLYQKPAVVEGSKGAVELLGADLFYTGDSCEAVSIDWPDGHVPRLSRHWWEMLVARLVKVDGHVAVNCQGGHGRTGTFLAIVACLLDEVPHSVCPVAWVRDKMGCDEQVETQSQCAYIERITGRTVTSEGSHMAGYGGLAISASEKKSESGNATDYLEKIKKAAWSAGFKVSGNMSNESGAAIFEVAEEDAGSFQTWLEDYDERFASVESDVVPIEPGQFDPWTVNESMFGDDGYDEWGNTAEDYRRMGWMI